MACAAASASCFTCSVAADDEASNWNGPGKVAAPTPTSARTAASSATSTASRPTGGRVLRARPDVPARARRRFFTSRSRPAAAPPAPTSGRSTARPTRTSTSTWASSTSCARSSARSGGPLAEAYVVAHEYGHHVQDLLGHAAASRRQRPGAAERVGPRRAAGRLLRRRLGATRRRDRLHRPSVTDADIADALDAAAAVGDDRIQQEMPGPGQPRDVDARLVGRSASTGSRSATERRPGRLRHLQRTAVGDSKTRPAPAPASVAAVSGRRRRGSDSWFRSAPSIRSDTSSAASAAGSTPPARTSRSSPA